MVKTIFEGHSNDLGKGETAGLEGMAGKSPREENGNTGKREKA